VTPVESTADLVTKEKSRKDLFFRLRPRGIKEGKKVGGVSPSHDVKSNARN